MKPRVLVTGGRTYSSYVTVAEVLTLVDPLVIVHGDATGADALAKRWANEHGVEQRPYPADWAQFGNSAGPRRNALMLKSEIIDLVVVFPGTVGTADMMRKAHAAGVPVKHWDEVLREHRKSGRSSDGRAAV